MSWLAVWGVICVFLWGAGGTSRPPALRGEGRGRDGGWGRAKTRAFAADQKRNKLLETTTHNDDNPTNTQQQPTTTQQAVLCYENNPLVRKALEEPGKGRVLVVDAGASMRCAVLGDNLAANALKNGWSGIVVNGCIRDSETIGTMAGLGVKALATHPLVSEWSGCGGRGVVVGEALVVGEGGGCRFHPAPSHDARCLIPHVARSTRHPQPGPTRHSKQTNNQTQWQKKPNTMAKQKSSKRDPGFRDVPVSFAGVRVRPGDWVYADADGILVAPHELKL